ncbi:MAG TPA: DUF4388 domain-containing protein [Planctomycetota bacterium]
MASDEREVSSLLAACRQLMRSILTLSRAEEGPLGGTLRIRAAKRHVHEAVASLNLDAGARPGPGTAAEGSLDRIADTLTRRLVQDLMAEVDREREPELESRVARVHDRDGFHGYTWAISLPDLMGLLQMQQKSGILRVNIGSEVVSLIIDAGDLIHASSDNSPSGTRLGEILVAQGAIERPRLEQQLLRYSAAPGRLGDTLEREGLITKQALRRALDTQVKGIFRRLFSAQDAYYSFRSGHSETSAGERRNVLQLLLETFRVSDEERAHRDGAT